MRFVLVLLLLSPYCAELLSGYNGHFTDPVALLGNLALLAPLYGAVAVLIREVTRRTGRGWPTILLLSAAAGLVQAGLVDQALFNHDYLAGTAYEEPMRTYVPWLDLDLSQLLTYVGGHLIMSFAAPIAVVEAFGGTRPWLGRRGLVVVTLGYLAAAAFFVNELVVTEGFVAGPVRLGGTGVAVLLLVWLAFALPRSSPVRGRAPNAFVVGVVALVLVTLHGLLREGDIWPWLTIPAAVVVIATLGWLLLRWSRRDGWTTTHVLAAAGGALLFQAGIAFLVAPVDSHDWVGKYVSNAVVFSFLVALLARGWVRSRRNSRVRARHPESRAG